MLRRFRFVAGAWALVGLLALAACGGGGDEAEHEQASLELPQALATPSQARWDPPVSLSLTPSAAANLADGKVLFWSAQDRWSFTNSPGSTYTVIFDPVTGTRTERLANENDHNMFCPGTTNLPDGRLLVNGGSSSGATSLFDPATNRWTTGATMNIPRAYQANTLLPDGSVLTLGGSWNGGVGNKHAEVWTAASGWRLLTGVLVDPMIGDDPGGVYRSDNHMWLIPTGHGRVLHAGPSARMNWIDTRGNGRVASAGTRGDDRYAINGSTVMYDVGKILKVGGAPAYENVDATSTAHLIDVTDGTARVRRLPSMAYARAFHNSVVLPNGQVVIIGGQTYPVPFSDNRSVLVPELWDPASETFTPLPPMRSPRNYHSSALLLPDARVLSVGGGLCGMGCASNHPDLEILTPHYLLNSDGSPAARPSILTGPTSVNYGTAATFTTSVPVSAFAMVRMSSTTHTVNNDQRRVPLVFTTTGDRQYRIDIPSNAGVALPGAWMLFALDAQGVPSVAKIIRLVNTATPQLQAPGDQDSTVGGGVNLALVASGSGTLSYAASNLPPGLSINASTGAISGSPTTTGVFQTTVSVANASGRVSSQVRWLVQQPLQGSMRYVRFEASSEAYGHPWSSIAEFDVLNRSGQAVSRVAWSVTADSQETEGEFAPVWNAVDGNPGTFWHTQWRNANPAHPHWITIDFGHAIEVGGFRYLPRQDASNGRIADWKFMGSLDGVGWTPLASGRFPNGAEAQTVYPIGAGANNRSPAVQSPGAQSNRVGESISLSIQASDADGDALTFAASNLPPGLSVSSSTGRITGTATAAGAFTVGLRVLDGKGGEGTASFDWTIANTALTVGPVQAPPAVTGSTVSYSANAQGSGLRYRWDFGDGSPVSAWSSSPNALHSYASAGVYTVVLSVSDSTNATQTLSFMQAIHAAVAPGGAARRSSPIGLQQPASGSARLWVVNPDADSVAVFDAATHARLGEVAVGVSPRTASVAPDGRLWVTNRDSSTISVVDLGTRTVVRTVALPRAGQPHGIVFAADGSAAFVALEARGQVLRLNPSTGATLATVSVGSTPRHLAITGDSARLLVSRYVSPPMPNEGTANVSVSTGGEVVLLNASTLAITRRIMLRHSDKADSTTQGRGVPNYLVAPAISPDGRSAWVSSKQDNVRRGLLRDGAPLDFQNTVRAITSRIDLSSLAEDYPSRIDHDNAGVASAAAFDPTGSYLFVALETSRQVAVIDPYARRELFRLDAGLAPQGLATSADGRRLYVQNFMDRTVQVYDLTRLLDYGENRATTLATLSSQSVEKLSASVLRGKRLFYDARDSRLARDAYVSCASCHEDGRTDGRVWDFTGFGEGLRNTISLRGRAGGQGPLHWSGNFDEVQDFEQQIRALAGGTGLMSDAQFNSGSRREPLGDRKAGVSADLDALAAYVGSLAAFDLSPFRSSNGALTSAGAAGRAVFESNCVTCHGGAGYTDSATGGVHNIGTLKPSSGKRLGGPLVGIDAPTLRDAWATAPYLHDGSASSISAAIAAHTNLSLSSTDRANVAAYVQQIGREESGFGPVTVPATAVRYVRLQALSEINGNPWSAVAELDVLDAAGAAMSRSGWTATADSQETAGEFAPAASAIDGDPDSFWHTQWQGANPAPPHTLTLDMKTARAVGGFRYLPRQVGTNGRIGAWRFFTSVDGSNWTLVAQGNFPATAAASTVAIATGGGGSGGGGGGGGGGTPANNPPALAPIADRTGPAGQAVTLALAGSDPDGDALIYTATGLPAGVALGGSSGTISGTPTTPGTSSVTVQVADGRGGTASRSFAWTVSAAPATLQARHVRLRALSEVNGNAWATMAEFDVLDATGAPLPRSGWTVSASSQDAQDDTAERAIDGLPGTFWHTEWRNATPRPPHDFRVDLGATRSIGGFRYLPRNDGSENGRIASWQFFISVDGTQWQQIGSGTFPNSPAQQSVTFGP